MQSSPSPTSIITNINQSNYLCSQTPEPQAPFTPTSQFKEDNLFLRPTKTNIRSNFDSNKSTPFKQIVIIQQEKISLQSATENNFIINGDTNSAYKMNDNRVKAGNYDFKNLAIHSNCISKFSNDQVTFLNQESSKNEDYNTDVKIDEYSTSKPKFYFTDNGVTSHNDSDQTFASNHYATDYNKERNLQLKSDDNPKVYNSNPSKSDNQKSSGDKK